MVWDDTLVGHAQVWADHLAETGKIRHDPNRDGEGENIAWFKGHKTAYCEDALVGWLVALKFFKQFISQKKFSASLHSKRMNETHINFLVLFFLSRYNREEPMYDYAKPGFSPETGHFSQVN